SVPISFFMRTEGLITFSTDAYTDEVRQVMAKKRHRDFPIHDERGNYIGMISRRNLLGMGKKQIIMVDHNEAKQAVDGIDQADILEIIDHHKLGAVETMNPVFFRNQPLGCTATIIYLMYKENNIDIDKKTAGLMCSAILSDTLMFRSPTCTASDVEAAKVLAQLAGIVIEDYAVGMFRAGSNLKDKTPEEIFFQDYKRFSVNEINFGVGQISSMDADELMDIKGKIMPYMEEQLHNQGINMIFFMLTNMIETSTVLIAMGQGSGQVIESAFDGAPKLDEGVYRLEGVVSRKKQLIPEILTAMSQE
ncbi:MAG: putative manganese-dependent inorganic diphosphatase, partial [Lachnospiraceae bacterium]